MAVKILLNGCKGRMGQAISSAAPENGCEIFGACDAGDSPEKFNSGCDAAIDFSFRGATPRFGRTVRKIRQAACNWNDRAYSPTARCHPEANR